MAEIDLSNSPRGSVSWVLNRGDVTTLLEYLRNAAYVVMDLETTGLDEHAETVITRPNGEKVAGTIIRYSIRDTGEERSRFVPASNGGVAARISIASFTLPQKDSTGLWDTQEPPTFLVPLSHPDSPWLGQWEKLMRLLAKAMVKYRSKYVNAHAKFDARWVYATTGTDITDLIHWDTQASSHLIDETQSTKLKEVVPRRFGIPPWDDHDLSYPGASEDVDLMELGDYACRDTYWTWRLFESHLVQLFLDPASPFDIPQTLEEVRDAKLGQVAKYVTTPTAISLGKMERTGIRLDVQYVLEQLDEQEQIASESLDAICEMYKLDRGRASMHATSKWFQEMTEIAVQERQLVVAERTGTGNARWDKHVLRKQARRGSETAQLILDGREAAKQAEFLTSWLGKMTKDGIIHSTYRAGHVATGRLSSASPNMQQVSKKLRKAFIPRDGYVIGDFDYSQLELRVAAFISRSEPMMEAYRAGEDLHRLFGADILTRRRRKEDPSAPAASLEEVSDEDRQAAKAGNFGLLYLQKAAGFREYADKVYGVDLTAEEAQEVYDGFFETWVGMREWHERTIKTARSHGFTSSPIGRVRNLEDLNSPVPYLREAAERQSVNSPVQGFGSDLMQMAIASMYGIMPGSTKIPGIRPVATVHDSVVIELEEAHWRDQAEEIQERMTNLDQWLLALGCDLDVPLVADATVGRRWGDDSISNPKA